MKGWNICEKDERDEGHEDIWGEGILGRRTSWCKGPELVVARHV